MKQLYLILAVIILYFLYFKSRKDKANIKIIAFLGIILSIVYITWRFFFTIPTDSGINIFFALLLIFFELIGIIQSFIFKFLFSTNKKIEILKDNKFEELATVDVMISTYNEPYDILERTIIGAKYIDYPKDKLNIYIGDDGKREVIKKLAHKHNVNYCIRNTNEHAKAGNLNNMLSKSKGEYILVLDADMIPKKTIIKKMISYFEDSKMGFVQSPQVFYNLDPFQYNLDFKYSIPNEQDFFMRTIEEKRAVHNAVLHVGTNAIFKREAIDKIGGIPIGSITEDMATGLLIQNAGYKSYFIKEALAIGLAPESFDDYIKQRDRWCRGNLQVYKKYNPLTMKNLSVAQKVIYSDGLLYWMFGLQKMVYIIAPLLYLILNIKILNTNGFDLIYFFIPYYISSNLFFKSLSDKTRNMSWSHIYDTSIAPQMSISFLKEALFSKFFKLKFNVTPKGIINKETKFKVKIAIAHIVIVILTVGAWFLSIDTIRDFNVYSESFSATAINLFWSVFNVIAVIISIFVALEKNRYRKTERTHINIKVKALITNCPKSKNCDCCGYTTDISESGTQVILNEKCSYFDYKENDEIIMNIKDIGDIKSEIVRLSENEKDVVIGLKFLDIESEQFEKINELRFKDTNKYINNTKLEIGTKYINIFKKIILNMKK